MSILLPPCDIPGFVKTFIFFAACYRSTKADKGRRKILFFCPADIGGPKLSALTGEYIKFSLCQKGMEYIGCQVGSRYKILSGFCPILSAAE